MGGGKGVEAGVSLGVVEVGGRVVAGARLHLGVVVGVEEGRRKVAGGHRRHCKYRDLVRRGQPGARSLSDNQTETLR